MRMIPFLTRGYYLSFTRTGHQVLKCHLSCFEVEGDTLRVLVGPFQSKLSSMEGVTPFAKAGLSFMAYETLKAHLVADEADVTVHQRLFPGSRNSKGGVI